jgi:hypothetical protein
MRRILTLALAAALVTTAGLAGGPAATAGTPTVEASALKCRTGYIAKTVKVGSKHVRRCVKDARTCQVVGYCAGLRSSDGRFDAKFTTKPALLDFKPSAAFPLPGCAPAPTDPLGMAILKNIEIPGVEFRTVGSRAGSRIVHAGGGADGGSGETADGRQVTLSYTITGKWTSSTSIAGSFTATQTRTQQDQTTHAVTVTDRCSRTVPFSVAKVVKE